MPRRTPQPSILAVPRSIVARVRGFIRERSLVRPGERVLVAVSGGPDSTCLLLALASLRRSLSFEIEAAYFDHGLRGKPAAEEERRFVACVTGALAIELHTGSGEVGAHARVGKRSLEEAARELRYRFLAQVARESGCTAVATGHTRDDQAETVLLHILRGSGLRGLAGMRASAPWPVRVAGAPRLVRPLLDLSRDDTERCCGQAGLTPIEDASNRSLEHTRNRIRHELLSALRTFNPRVKDALVRLAETAGQDIELLEQLAAAAVSTREHNGEARLDRRALLEMPEALRRYAVRLAFAALLGNGRGLAERHVASVLAAAGQTGSRLNLPRGLRVEVSREAVVLRRGAAEPTKLPDRAAALSIPGEARLGHWRLTAEVLLRRRPRSVTSGGPFAVVLDGEALGERLSVRRRRPGDRFQPLGLSRTKKLQDFLVDAHVPRSERDAVPLVCAERGIAWVVGQRPAEWAKVRPETRRFVRLRAERDLDRASGVR